MKSQLNTTDSQLCSLRSLAELLFACNRLTKPDDENCHESDEDMDILPPPPKLASFIQVLEDVKHFL